MTTLTLQTLVGEDSFTPDGGHAMQINQTEDYEALVDMQRQLGDFIAGLWRTWDSEAENWKYIYLRANFDGEVFFYQDVPADLALSGDFNPDILREKRIAELESGLTYAERGYVNFGLWLILPTDEQFSQMGED